MAANAIALAIAWYQDWGPASLMPAYWAQSVVIGVAVFALNHAWSNRYNRELDRRGTPKIGMPHASLDARSVSR